MNLTLFTMFFLHFTWLALKFCVLFKNRNVENWIANFFSRDFKRCNAIKWSWNSRMHSSWRPFVPLLQNFIQSKIYLDIYNQAFWSWLEILCWYNTSLEIADLTRDRLLWESLCASFAPDWQSTLIFVRFTSKSH